MRRRRAWPPVYYILDNEHHIVPVKTGMWEKWFEASDRSGSRNVGCTKVGDDIMVSTIFLGFDHSFGLVPGPPVVFETVILGGLFDGWCRRYSSWDDAETGHKVAVRRVREALKKRVRP